MSAVKINIFLENAPTKYFTNLPTTNFRFLRGLFYAVLIFEYICCAKINGKYFNNIWSRLLAFHEVKKSFQNVCALKQVVTLWGSKFATTKNKKLCDLFLKSGEEAVTYCSFQKFQHWGMLARLILILCLSPTLYEMIKYNTSESVFLP